MKQHEGLEEWLDSYDTGLSSMCMAHVLCGVFVPKRDRHHHPHDPADFGRCVRFLEQVPSAEPGLAMMAGVSVVWSRYVEHWHEMLALYREEWPTGRAPKLFAMMRKLQGADT